MHGWLRDTAQAGPCHIQVLHGGALLAEALADLFRRDLLMGGHGHGHYGFAARLRHALPPGPCSLVLHLPRNRLSAPMQADVPALLQAAPVSVEALLRTPPGWMADDLLARPACLDMDEAHAAMGTPRFVDGLFRFVLERWPSAPEQRLHTANLQAGRLAPQDLLVELLSGRERADMPPELVSPYDPDFPFFTKPQAGAPAA